MMTGCCLERCRIFSLRHPPSGRADNLWSHFPVQSIESSLQSVEPENARKMPFKRDWGSGVSEIGKQQKSFLYLVSANGKWRENKGRKKTFSSHSSADNKSEDEARATGRRGRLASLFIDMYFEAIFRWPRNGSFIEFSNFLLAFGEKWSEHVKLEMKLVLHVGNFLK